MRKCNASYVTLFSTVLEEFNINEKFLIAIWKLSKTLKMSKIRPCRFFSLKTFYIMLYNTCGKLLKWRFFSFYFTNKTTQTISYILHSAGNHFKTGIFHLFSVHFILFMPFFLSFFLSFFQQRVCVYWRSFLYNYFRYGNL